MKEATPGATPAAGERRAGTLHLVRHAQASFGAADYDQLSELGQRQALRLGQYWRERGQRFDAVIMGTLKRHRQTWEGIAAGLGLADVEPLAWPGLNEYHSQALIAALYPDTLPKPNTPALYREHFRRLREGLNAWMQGRTQPLGMPSYAEFSAGVAGALDQVREKHPGGRVLLVSSGGPISTAVGQVLETSAAATVELNLRTRNTGVTEFAYTPKRHALVSFNALPHLDGPAFEGWVTHS